MALGGVFIDILARLNLASVDRVLKDVNTAMREGGKSSSRAFSEGFTLDGAKAQFGELAKASQAAYDDMARNLDNLRIQESRLNDLRARNFRASTDVMIAAQRDFDAALANSMKLQEAADARAAKRRAGVTGMDTATWRRQVYDPAGSEDDRGRRSVPAPIRRGTNIVAAGAALGAAGVAGEGVKYAAQEQANLNDILSRHQDTLQNIQVIQQGIHQIVRDTGFSPGQVTAAAEAAEQAGYRGADVLKVLDTAARTARVSHAELGTTLAGLTTTLQDFGVKALAGKPEKATEFLTSMNDIAGKFIVTVANLKDVNPAEYFKSLANIEPIAAQTMQNVPKIEATTQVDAIAAMMSQIGMPPERGMLNLAQAMSKMSNAKGVTATAMEQLGLKPEGIATEMRDQGFIPVLHTIQAALDKKRNPETGMYNMGWHINDAGQLQDLQQMAVEQLQGLGDQGQLGLNLINSPNFQAADVGFKVNKSLQEAGVTNPDVTGAVKSWLGLQQKLHGPSQMVKGGMMPDLTEAQVISSLTGTGDVQRAVTGSLQNIPMLDSLQTQYSAEGTSQGFTNAFKQWEQALDPQIKILGGQLKDLAESLGDKILPTLNNWVKGLNEFLDKFPGVAQGIVVAMGSLAAAWGAAKIVGIISALGPAFELAGNAARGVGTLLMDMTGGSKLARMAEGAQLLGAAETTTAAAVTSSGVGAKLITAGTAAETLATAETVTAGEITAAGAGGKLAAVATAATALSGALTAGLIAMQSIDIFNPKANESAPPPGQRSLWDTFKSWMSNGEADVPHHARGGIVGYAGGSPFAGLGVDPTSQPLMGQPDMKRDSLLGMLPNGMPVGLRGGEGILTPDAVERLGGKGAVDSLNNDPWSNPLKVASTFYGSFAKGFAKYAKGPLGKAATGTSQTIDDLEKAFDQSTSEHEAGGGESKMLDRLMAAGISPEQLQAMGVTVGKRGGLKLPNGQYLEASSGSSERGSGKNWWGSGSGAPKDVKSAIMKAYRESGFPANQFGDIENIISGESGFRVTDAQGALNNWDSNAAAGNPSRGLGQLTLSNYAAQGVDPHTDDPYLQAKAMLGYIAANHGGTPASNWAYWQQNRNYSRGGIVGYVPPPPRPPRDDKGGGPLPGGGPGDNLPSNGRDGSWPDWWRRSIDQHFDDIPEWMPQYGGYQGPGPSGVIPMRPSHLPGKNGIGGFSRGGVVGFTGGGVAPWYPKHGNTAGLPPEEFDQWARDLYQPGWNYGKFMLNGPLGIGGPAEFNDRPGVHFDDRDSGQRDWNTAPDYYRRTNTIGAARGGVIGFDPGGIIPMPPSITTAAAGPGGIAPLDRGPGSPGGNPPSLLGQPRPGSAPPGAKPVNADPTKLPNKPGSAPPGATLFRPGADSNKPSPAPLTAPPQFAPPGTTPGNAPASEARPGEQTFKESPSRPGNTNNQGKGFGLSGGIIGAAEGAASSAADAFAPGSGAAAQILFQLANRAIGYAGQVGGIALEGIRQTFLPNNSALADNGLAAKLIGGIVGAHPSPQNMAGMANQMKALQPKGDLDESQTGGKQVYPGVQINGDVHNHGQQEWNGLSKAINQASFFLPVGGGNP